MQRKSILIEKTNSEKIEIHLPAFFKQGEATFTAVFSEDTVTRCIGNTGLVTYGNIDHVNLKDAEQITRGEWLDIYEATKQTIKRNVAVTYKALTHPFEDEGYADMQMREFDEFMTASNNYHDMQNEKHVHRELEKQF